jgi:hypothetical protein
MRSDDERAFAVHDAARSGGLARVPARERSEGGMKIKIEAWDSTGNIIHTSDVYEVEVGDTGKFSILKLDIAARKVVKEVIQRRGAWRASQTRKAKEAK